MTSQPIKELTKETIEKSTPYKDSLFFAKRNEPYGSWHHFETDYPTQADITDWLRVEQNIHVFCYPIDRGTKKVWGFGIMFDINTNKPYLYNHEKDYTSCEEACEDAILFVFQNQNFK